MKKYILFLCALFTLTAGAQKVSEGEAFQKAKKFLSDKKLKAPRARTRGEEVSKPFYVFNAEDGKGSIIISGDERLPDVLAYSKETSIDENNIPDALKDLVPILAEGVGVNWYGEDNGTPDEYVPRNTTRVERIIPYSNQWNQDYPYNAQCPYMPGEYTDWLRNRAPVGCVPISTSQIMNFYKYPKHVGSFNATYSITPPGASSSDIVTENIPATDFKWNSMGYEYHFSDSDTSPEEKDALSELCYHVGRALGAIYGQYATGVYMNKVGGVLRDLYGFEVEEIKYSYYNRKSNGEEICEYLPDADYWNFLDSHLEKGIPILASGARHAYVIDGRDEYGMYLYFPYYIIIQPSLYVQIGFRERLSMNKNLHLIAFNPPGYTYTSIDKVKADNPNDDAVYNLQGRKVGDKLEGLPKGVYIKDGKKYIVK